MDEEHEKSRDIPIGSAFADQPVNGSVYLYTGSIQIRAGDHEATGQGNVVLELMGGPKLRFHVDCAPTLAPTLDGVELALPDQPGCVSSHGVVLSVVLGASAPKGMAVSGILTDPGIVIAALKPNGDAEPVGRMQFHLVNFRDYVGTPLHVGDTTRHDQWAGRATIPFGKWTVTLDEFMDTRAKVREARATNGYALTHTGVLSRSDNKLFDPAGTRSVFEALYWFLSFANGGRCGYTMVTGLRHLGYPLWQNWCPPSADPLPRGENWFEPHAPVRCFEAGATFYACWTDERKREWLRAAIGLYLASNRFHGGIELTLANSQIALEMLSWVALMEERALMSDESFAKLPAADRLRALLFWLGVDGAIPSTQVELRRAYPNRDAPEAVVDIRNLVIHPTRDHRVRRQQISNDAIFEAWQLNMWYAESVILKLIGYTGPRNNRLRSP